MKPNPFASLNHFTFPVAMTETFLRGLAPRCSRRDGGVIRRHWRTNKKRRANWISRGVCLRLQKTRTEPDQYRVRVTRMGRRVNRILSAPGGALSTSGTGARDHD